MKQLLMLTLSILYLTISGQEITGTWNGALDIQGTKLRIVFHIEQSENGLQSKMDSPDQGAKGIATDKTTFENGKLIIESNTIGFKYEGELKAEENEISGNFYQSGMTLPLVLSRKAVEIKVEKRPQDPVDYPYLREEVTFENKEDGVSLAGTLSLPEGKAPKAIVILVSGSGPQNRDEEIAAFNHRPFLVLSDYLTRNGIGVLRYDDRGVGESSGTQQGATSFDFAEDAAAAVKFLRTKQAFKKTKVGMIGHSEGGMIAPIVETELADLDFIISLAGPGTTIDELLLAQSRLVSKQENVPQEMVEANHKILKPAYQYLIEHEAQSEEELKEGLRKIFEAGITYFPEETQTEIRAKEEAFLTQEVDGLVNPWFLYFIRYNPMDYWSKVDCPVLALNGKLDVQVPCDENLEGIKKGLEKGGNKNYTIQAFENLNHLFQTAETGAVSEYKEIEETFNEKPMQLMVEWINKL